MVYKKPMYTKWSTYTINTTTILNLSKNPGIVMTVE
jgi:hypothetical protein